MGYYKVLSKPTVGCMSNYKGLYRFEQLPQTNEKNRFMTLWQRYILNIDKTMGVTTELTIDELKEFADLSAKATGEYYEVIYFSEVFECPHPANYYGVDVTGFGGYSMLGENFFKDSEGLTKGIYNLYDVLNQYFRPKLNSKGLFNTFEDAMSFLTVLNNLNTLSPGCVEEEDWRAVHIFKVI